MIFTVLCPYGRATGGIELLHQLVHALNSQGFSGRLLYYPFRDDYSVMPPYQSYNIELTTFSSVVCSDFPVVLPETLTYLAHLFSFPRVIIWWMSVDNYLRSGSFRFAAKNRLNPLRYMRRQSEFSKLLLNIYQSDYARRFLELRGITGNLARLSDYLNDDFLQGALNIEFSSKKNIIAYNPSKGLKRISRLIRMYPDLLSVPIQNMTRIQVADLLSQAKVYLDFGNHPGKDRIPREAAALGCIVITNLRGSAGNLIDIPIPSIYKFNDSSTCTYSEVKALVDDIFVDYPAHYERFNGYRMQIASERTLFFEDVRAMVQLVSTASAYQRFVC